MADRPKWVPRRLMDFVGMEALTRHEMQNAYVVIPAGTRVKIDGATAWHKIRVIGPACKCCGVAPVISRVHVNDLREAVAVPSPESK